MRSPPPTFIVERGSLSRNELGAGLEPAAAEPRYGFGGKPPILLPCMHEKLPKWLGVLLVIGALSLVLLAIGVPGASKPEERHFVGDGHDHSHEHGDVHGHSKTIDPVLVSPERPTIQVFTGGCALCAKALSDSLAIAKQWGYNVREYKIDGPEAKQLGLKAAPSILLDGKLLFDHAPSLDELKDALRKDAGPARPKASSKGQKKATGESEAR